MTTMQKHQKKRFSHRKRNRILRHCEGFTLNEVIIVMVILGIIAAIGFPSYLKWLPNIRLKNAGRDLFANMQDAKIGAIKENTTWAVIFTPGDNSYTVCSNPGVDNDWATIPGNDCSETVNLTQYKSRIKYGQGDVPNGQSATNPPAAFPADYISYTNNYVTFDPRGTGTAGYVYLENEQGTALALGTLTSGVIRFFQWKGTWQ